MQINQKKTKNMIFNFTNNNNFATRLEVNNENIETVETTTLLEVIVTSDLKWEENTKSLMKRAYGRMQLLQKVASFTCNKEWKTFFKSISYLSAPY